MEIISIEVQDPMSGWELKPTEFFPNITLLVGLSGVGKTRILESIRKVSKISRGKKSAEYAGFNWAIAFSHDGAEFEWKGAYVAPFQNMDTTTISLRYPFRHQTESEPAELATEILTMDGVTLAERNGDTIILRGAETPKLSSSESIIHILKNEDGIRQASEGMDSILFVDQAESPESDGFYSFGSGFERLKNKFTSIDEIRSEDMPTRAKLALVHENCKAEFKEIERQFIEAFDHVSELGLHILDGPYGTVPRLFIKENGVSKLIPEEGFSSGMRRTLLHLSRMSLWPDGTVVLIDEFENSFGVNCIDYVTEDLKIQSQRMQFILTSHHPYIINNIDKRNWRIVSRSGGSVHVRSSRILEENKSHHEAFIQLMNLPEYSEGILAG